MSHILVTGSCGLIGSALGRHLTSLGYEVTEFDSAMRPNSKLMDITNPVAVTDALKDCTGVIHFAAVSRVKWGEQDHDLCQAVNVEGTRNVLASASHAPRPPWILVASSREVYGQADVLPVPESAELRPVNHYGRTKLEVENMVTSYREAGLRASVIRFSNVYGSVADHPDRVVPAFARLAAKGGTLPVEGPETTLDFTYIDDVITALQTATEMLTDGAGPLPPLHLVSGRGTTLAELADMAITAAGQGTIEIRPGRTYDVETFVGDPARAEQVLGWRASTPVEDGVSDLVMRFTAAREPQ